MKKKFIQSLAITLAVSMCIPYLPASAEETADLVTGSSKYKEETVKEIVPSESGASLTFSLDTPAEDVISSLEIDTMSPSWDLLRLTNKERIQAGLAPLSSNDDMDALAYLRAVELADYPNSSCLRPDGSSFYTILDEYEYPWISASENDAAGTLYPSAPMVFAAWMNTSQNRNIILEADKTHVGSGYFWMPYDYQNYWTQLLLDDGCTPAINGVVTDISVGQGYYRTGTPIDGMSLILELSCDSHGISYMPVVEEMCSGLNVNQPGRQNLTVKYLSDEISGSIVMHPFNDIGHDWFTETTIESYLNGYMTGMNSETFGPTLNLSRAQFAVILHRMVDSPSVSAVNPFPDVPAGTWYTDAVLWASANGIITGYSHNGRFGSADNITREQMAVMMYRFAAAMGYEIDSLADFSNYPDAGKVSAFAETAMQWAVGNGIITGKQGTYLDPQGNASRAECATIIMRFVNLYGI